jgi:hypothetical protein
VFLCVVMSLAHLFSLAARTVHARQRMVTPSDLNAHDLRLLVAALQRVGSGSGLRCFDVASRSLMVLSRTVFPLSSTVSFGCSLRCWTRANQGERKPA